MGNVVKCYDIANMILEEANKQFKPLWQANDDKVTDFNQYCEMIDTLIEEIDAESIEVEVDDVRMMIIVRVECVSMEVDSQSHVFHELAKRAVSFGFSEADGNTVIKFVFSGIWDKTIA